MGRLVFRLGFVIAILGVIGITIALFYFTVQGIILAFSASILLGILVLIFEPAPLVIGLYYFLTNTNLAQQLVDHLSK